MSDYGFSSKQMAESYARMVADFREKLADIEPKFRDLESERALILAQIARYELLRDQYLTKIAKAA